MDALDTRCLCKILGIKWNDFVKQRGQRDIQAAPCVSHHLQVMPLLVRPCREAPPRKTHNLGPYLDTSVPGKERMTKNELVTDSGEQPPYSQQEME